MDKYRTILQAKEGELDALKDKAASCPWKPFYHIHPEFGLMNDPNGLAFFNGEYHVFYQWYPYGPIHGMKHWGHVKSKDLSHWERMPVAIIPTENYESHGAYSGGALAKDDQLYLYYTGNIKFGDESHMRDANQCLAVLDNGGEIQKHEKNPVIEGTPEGYTGHVRDPKVWKQGDSYYMVLGAQRENETGTLIIYESGDAVDWSLKGELKTNLGEFGYMWECPDYFQLDGRDVLVFSPQGIGNETGNNFQNIFNVIYAVGKMDLEKLEFIVEHYQEIDKGFDFYAPQTFEGKDGRRLMFAWAGVGETEFPSDKNMWAHMLTLPRELHLDGNILKQKPANELKSLRSGRIRFEGSTQGTRVLEDIGGNAVEMSVRMSPDDAALFGLELFHSNQEGFRIEFDRMLKAVSIDRRKFNNPIKSEKRGIRTAGWIPSDQVELTIFIDKSIVEIFIDDGETVFTSRVFPEAESIGVQLFSDKMVHWQVDQFNLTRGIE
ncbi:glycoside hydrolase family 32 protein [Bacillus sp. T33-2]|uniref:glycoside hydrolase family 32 protein n=1 Tax=Bacillus sp. T33-2 TaxID=2054168 RepID=UPI000C779EC4|nr:sucrose-6-phosphate hydrolase [Bacillus sp. T33-2]PLR94186.1 glycosyl hydrolase family 32 [Bacillus sp. T33-2]